MGKQERFRKVDRSLWRAGLEVLTGGVPEAVLPVRAVGAAASSPEPGIQFFFAEYGAPQLVKRLNQGWYELAVSIGLFDGRREFLLALPSGTLSAQQLKRRMVVGPPVSWSWRRVRLRDRWDVMGAGAAGFLGIHRGHPGFFMLSVDGGAAVICTTSETGVEVIAVPDPGTRKSTRHVLQWLHTGTSPGIDPLERAEARQYVRLQQSHAGSRGQPV